MSFRNPLSVLQISAVSILLLACSLAHAIPPPLKTEPTIAISRPQDVNNITIKRSDFPADFLFGASTSAMQIEGSLNFEGKGPTLWDKFEKKQRAQVHDGSFMDTSIDSYKRYKEDLEHLKNLSVNSYRFSISWARILPEGSLKGGLNQPAIDHYNSIIDILVKYGIKPVVTLHHFDIPGALEDKYGGFLNYSIVNDFKDYAEVCFKNFGDRVKTWITINEPLVVTQLGYDMGFGPPGRCSDRKICPAGNSTTEPYIVNHNLLLSHAAVSKLYKEKYQKTQGGEVGISLVGQYYEPFSMSPDDIAAQQRALDFAIGWYLDPLVNGEYPAIMKELVKDRLPTFTPEQKTLVKGSLDFVGLNYYTTRYAKSIPVNLEAKPVGYAQDQFINLTFFKNEVPIGPKAEGDSDIYIYPQGLQKVLEYIDKRYQSPKLYITENGVTEERNDTKPMAEALNDQHRITFIEQHLSAIHGAIKNGANVKAYFYWSLFDSYEWLGGYTLRYGLYFIDFKNDLKRIPKASVSWFRDFMQCGNKTGAGAT